MNKLAILGCASSVGKTTIATALCRYYANHLVSPFKAFNLSSEGFIHNEKMIGHAQYIQSLAAKTEYSVYMNPILKKCSNTQFAMYVNGDKVEELPLDEARMIVDDAYSKLCDKYQSIIVEGSGSVCELNLKDYDIANMSFALKHKIPVILVADISRGGIFGTVYGNLMLLNEEERKLVKGIIINKFDGDPTFFEEGVRIIEELCNIKVIGVVPTIKFQLPEEDSVVNNLEYSEKEIEESIKHITENVTNNLDMEFVSKIMFNK